MKWSKERIREAIVILRRNKVLDLALSEMSAAFGEPIGKDSLRGGFRRFSDSKIDTHLGADDTEDEAPTTERRPPVLPEVKLVQDSWTLEAFATPVELEALRALAAHGWSVRDAASASGLSESAIRHRALRVKRRAASRGFAPEADWNHPVPEGHRIKGNSTLYDENGKVDQQWVKSERDSDDPPAVSPVPEGHLIKKVSTLLDAHGNVRAQWLQAPKDEATRWEQFWAACERNAAEYKGAAEPIACADTHAAHMCTVYPLGDPHIGMLSWSKETGQDFDLAIAERDLVGAVDLLVDRAPASTTAILANVGDFFHAEDDAQRTPASGHKLDVDTRWAKIADIGFRIMRHLVDRLLQKHAIVHVVNVPGNHDPKMARMLNMWMAAVYEREPRVSITDNRNPYMYIRHGRNLFGFAHGDGAKTEALPSVMAADRAEDWGATEFRFWFTGHIHHQTRKEFPGCVVESFRTLAARDYWHASKGYRSGQSLSCITFHDAYGEITRSTVDLKLARAEQRSA